MSQFRDQKRLTISEVATDWHEHYAAVRGPQSPHLRTVGQTVQHADIPPPQSATLSLYPVARKLLLIFYPAEGRRLIYMS